MSFENLNLRNINTLLNNSMSAPAVGRTTLIGNTVLKEPPAIPSLSNGIVFKGDEHDFVFSQEQLSKGCLILGSTGSGKTTIFKSALNHSIPSMTENDVMFVFDSKGDFYSKYSSGNDCVVISARDEDADIASNWNIYGELFDAKGTFKSLDIYAREISKALFKGMESPTQPFFHMAAADVFAAILGAFCRDAQANGNYSTLNNRTLTDFISGAEVKDIYKLTDKYPKYRYIHSYLGSAGSMTTQALGVLGYLYGMANSMFVGPFGDSACTAGQFSVRRLMREKKRRIIFLEYDLMLGETLSPIYSLFFDLAAKEALSTGKGNSYFVVDEMNLLPHCTMFEPLINYGRSRGTKILSGLQSINQLYKNYGVEEGKALAAGFVNAICLNSVDYDTRRHISERFGSTYENISYGGMNIQREGFTVEDSGIHNLKVGEAFVDLAGCDPFKFKFKYVA